MDVKEKYAQHKRRFIGLSQPNYFGGWDWLATLGVSMQRIKCPCCGADVKDWREFVKNHPKLAVADEAEKPFQCVGFRCGKRFSEAEILQGEQNGEG